MCVAANTVTDLPWQVIAGIFILTTVMIYATRRKLTRAPVNPRAAARQRENAYRRQNRAETELRDVLIELEKAAREITAQIDTRFHKLEALIRDADRHIAAMRDRETSHPASAREDQPGADHLNILVGDDGVESGSIDSATAMPSRSADFERVCALADRKLTPREIAARVQRPLGEVELMLAMRTRRGPVPSSATGSGPIE